ncbi:hypothetical protein AG1IA_08435 [Rhizoctonia solani AG-1 IA]|uniref:Uncharacterized protein n=1 Tax=Thanatephorus cucumeris (strain AG1-IA) TaxID=983506 RepID=L8WLA7_THACA|nr:hypothetical protein AG1IA_08435 [Rhizoctonia solani AG-1 IA]
MSYDLSILSCIPSPSRKSCVSSSSAPSAFPKSSVCYSHLHLQAPSPCVPCVCVARMISPSASYFAIDKRLIGHASDGKC